MTAPKTTNIVDIKDQLEEKKFIEDYSRLWNLAKQREADVIANPRPFIVYAFNLVRAYEARIEKMRCVLVPAMLLKSWENDAELIDYRNENAEKLHKLRKLAFDPIEVSK